MNLDEWATVTVGPDQSARDVARKLLELADDPSQVRTTSGGTEFLVHPLVAEKYTKPAAPRRGRRKKSETEDDA